MPKPICDCSIRVFDGKLQRMYLASRILSAASIAAPNI